MMKKAESKTIVSNDSYENCIIACTLTERSADIVQMLGKKIAVADLFYDKPLLFDPHLTVLRGINPEMLDIGKIKSTIVYTKLEIKITGFDLLSPDSRPYDILSLSLGGHDLLSLNKRLKRLLSADEDFDYKPHISIVFLKKGKGQHYLSKLETVQIRDVFIEIKNFVIFDQLGNCSEIFSYY